jgi:hypothetical protein
MPGHAQAAAPAKLVQLVRDATKQFVDVNAATAAGQLIPPDIYQQYARAVAQRVRHLPPSQS